MTDYADLEKRLRASIYDSLDVLDEAALKADVADALASLTCKLEEAQTALEPFARIADRWSDRLPDDARIGGSMVMRRARAVDLEFEPDYLVGDLRRAAKVYRAMIAAAPDLSRAQPGQDETPT